MFAVGSRLLLDDTETRFIVTTVLGLKLDLLGETAHQLVKLLLFRTASEVRVVLDAFAKDRQ